MKKVLLVNPINVGHDRRISDLRRSLPRWDIRCLYNPAFPWFADKARTARKGDVFFRNGCLPRRALADVSGVVLFTAQPRIPPASLVQEAAIRSIPVIVIQETHQMALEQERVNNYFLPVDYILAASAYEKEVFERIGVPDRTIRVTGCFFTHKERPLPNAGERALRRRAFGLRSGDPVAALTLRYLTRNGETAVVRDAIMSFVANGLPAGYQLLVKPHPGDEGRDIVSCVKRSAPQAVVAPPTTPIEDVLDAADVLFDRGNSQVVFDAICRKVPVAVVPMGRRTLFHGIADGVIVNDAGDIPPLLDRIRREGMALYEGIRARYLSVDPGRAYALTMEAIDEIAGNGVLNDPSRRLLEMALFWAWMGYPHKALSALSASGKGPIRDSLARLAVLRADRRDVAVLTDWIGQSYKSQLIESLWVKTLYLRGCPLAQQDIGLCDRFPPRMNGSYYLEYAQMLCWLLFRSGYHAEGERLSDVLQKEYGPVVGSDGAGKASRRHYSVGDYYRARAEYGMRQGAKRMVLRVFDAMNAIAS